MATFTEFLQFRILENLTSSLSGDTSYENDEAPTNRVYVPNADLQPYIQFYTGLCPTPGCLQ